LLKDKETLFLTYNRLYKKEPGLIKNISHQEVATSALFSLKNMKSKEDSLAFIEKRIVPVYSHNAEFYFFKIQNISEDKDPYDYNPDKITGIAFLQEDNTINPAAYKIMASKVIIDEDELENNMKEMIDSVLNGDKTRASFTKEDDYNRMPYSEYDYDY